MDTAVCWEQITDMEILRAAAMAVLQQMGNELARYKERCQTLEHTLLLKD